MRSLLTFAALTGLLCLPGVVSAQTMSVDQAVAEARRVNPQVRAARFRWESAKHQIIQNYTPPIRSSALQTQIAGGAF